MKGQISATQTDKVQVTVTIPSKLLQRIVFDWFLLVGIYLSYVIFTAVQQSEHIWRSLTALGWLVEEEDGRRYWGRLAFYALFTVGFLIYQTRLFTKISGRKQHAINWLMFAGAFFLVAGCCIPVNGDATWIIGRTHTLFVQIGSVIMVLAIGLMVLTYCRKTTAEKSSKVRLSVTYLAIAVIMALGLLFTGARDVTVCAMFSLMATFMVMAYTHFLTVSYELAPKK